MSNSVNCRFCAGIKGEMIQEIFVEDSHTFAVTTPKIGLSTTQPNDDDVHGNNITEPAGNGYARVDTYLDTAHWSVPNNGEIHTTYDIIFPEATGDWSSVGWWFLADGAGSPIIIGRLVVPITIHTGKILKFFAGNLVMNLTRDVGGFSTYNANVLLNKFIRRSAINITPRIGTYLALSTTAPNADGTHVTEPVGGGYTREMIVPGTYWALDANKRLYNTVLVEWDGSTSAWGDIGWWGLYDSPTGGNFCHSGELSAIETVLAGHIFTLPVASLLLELKDKAA